MIQAIRNVPQGHFRKTKRRTNFRQGMLEIDCNVAENSRRLGSEKGSLDFITSLIHLEVAGKCEKGNFREKNMGHIPKWGAGS